MKRLLLLQIIVFSSIISFGQAPVFEWAKGMGGTMESLGYSVGVDGGGNVYTVGTFGGVVDFDPGSGVFNLTAVSFEDMYILKLDSIGNFVWAKQFGGDAVGFSIKVDWNGDIYATGHFGDTIDFDPGPGVFNLIPTSMNVFILKLEASGSFVWAKSIRGTGTGSSFGSGLAKSITTDTNGNVYVTGYSRGMLDFDPGIAVYNLTSVGGGDVFILKLDSLGNFIWAKLFGGSSSINYDFGEGVAVDDIGNVYTIGNFPGTVDFDPGAGVYNMTSSGGNDIFVLKLDSSGNFIWVKILGGVGDDHGASIVVDTNENVHTTGYFDLTADFDPGSGTYNLTASGYIDVFISKLDINGDFVWAKKVGGGYIDIGLCNTLDIIGNLYITGYFFNTADFDPGSALLNVVSNGGGDIFILKLNSAGNFIWVKSMGGSSDEMGMSIVLDAFGGNIYTTGSYSDIVDFNQNAGLYNLVSAGGTDIFVHKMSQPPVGIQEYNSNSNFISLFPNPTTNNFTIETINPTNISIVNLLGQELFNSKIDKSQTIDVSFLSNGIYFVKDLNNGGSVKFVKQ